MSLGCYSVPYYYMFFFLYRFGFIFQIFLSCLNIHSTNKCKEKKEQLSVNYVFILRSVQIRVNKNVEIVVSGWPNALIPDSESRDLFIGVTGSDIFWLNSSAAPLIK